MSPRITRSAARTAANLASAQAFNAEDDDSKETSTPSATRQAPSQKRKASARDNSSTETSIQQDTPSRRSKRPKVRESVAAEEAQEAVLTPLTRTVSLRRQRNMSTSGYRSLRDRLAPQLMSSSPSNGEEDDVNPAASSSSRKKQAKGKKPGQSTSFSLSPSSTLTQSTAPAPSTPQNTTRRAKKVTKQTQEENTKPEDSLKRASSKTVIKKGNREPKTQTQASPMPTFDDDMDMDDEDDDMDDGGDAFPPEGFLGRGGPTSLSHARALLGGLIPHPGTATRLRGLLQSIKSHDDPSLQILAMEELAELLLVSNEDSLNGQFAPDQFAKELVLIMKGGELGMSTPEMMELACRCIANLLEALPQATHSVVTSGAIPVLCEKLTNMEYMEQAEQAMTTLSKISDEFPGAIVREGGLLACLVHLDFFTTYMQKTAVSTAAKCCYDLSESSFDAVLQIMPILQNILNDSEQEVVKQAALCITRIVDRFGDHQKLEELVRPELLQTVFRLLLPASANIVGDDVQTRFLSLLGTVARSSTKLTIQLLENNVVDIIFQFLTGVSPPDGEDDLGSEIDGVLVMQALIHKPRDQIFGALNVICQILPDIPGEESATRKQSSSTASRSNRERLAAFESCKGKVRRFVMILLPTLAHAFDITVNLNVRSTVLDAQLRMLSNIDSEILESALRTVPFASFLSSILSQEDHPNLVLKALQATELLFTRLKKIYAYQFCREGVLTELKRLASSKSSDSLKSKSDSVAIRPRTTSSPQNGQTDGAGDHEDEDGNEDSHMVEELGAGDENESVEEYSGSVTSSDEEMHTHLYSGDSTKSQIAMKARKILEGYNDVEGREIKGKAEAILEAAGSLTLEIRNHYIQNYYQADSRKSAQLFDSLAHYFSTDALESMTSAELLNSSLIEILLEIVNPKHKNQADDARRMFVMAFMKTQATPQSTSTTPFHILVHRLQDLLSRMEHLEVVTVHNNSQEHSRMDKDNLSYQLGKQIRLKLEGDESSDIPARYRNVVVSIHAIATFKSLNDYLRPRMQISADGLSRSDVLSTLAALTGADYPHRQRLIDMERALLQSRSESQGDPTGNASEQASSRSLRETAAANQVAQNAPQTSIFGYKQAPRRSSRRHKSSTEPHTPSSAEKDVTSATQDPLECVDEHNLEEDEDGDDDDDDEELDAFVEDLDKGIDDEPAADPSPVNLEIASTGKVTARQEDGARVATPIQGTPSNQTPTPTGRHTNNRPSGPQGPSRTRSYAAALQSTPQDWHLEFSIEGKPIPLHATVYRAIHSNKIDSSDSDTRSVWGSTHLIKYRKVLGPLVEPTTLSSPLEPKDTDNLPDSLHKNPITSKILRLLDFLHDVNGSLNTIIDEKSSIRSLLSTESAAQFVNTKLTAKLNRQLEEPLVVASRCLPRWTEDLVRLYPFLFPFEARYLYLQSSYFGYHRAIERWTHAQNEDSRRDRRRDDRPYLSIPKKQKVRIARERLFDSAVKVLDLYASATASLEVEYFDEVGTGLGPTMEFYSNVSKDFALKKLNLWRQNESASNSEYTFSKQGLFPAPMSAKQAATDEGKKILSLFKTLGKFVARSMLDSRMIDISFNPLFFRIGQLNKSLLPPLATIKLVDQDLANSIKHLQGISHRAREIESGTLSDIKKTKARIGLNTELELLGLDMTLPGYPELEIVNDGQTTDLKLENLDTYLGGVADLTINRGVLRQIEAFQKGFSEVFSYNALHAFTADELVMIFGGSTEDWSIATLLDSIKADHGFNIDSKSVRNLIQVMSEMDDGQRRLFLQFVTGSPKLPIGGFKKLMPTFTVVLRKDDSGFSPDEFLPSVMTCTNYLKLPDYSSLELMRMRIRQAIEEGQGAFHLS